MKKIVIYHRADFDGIFCREIAKRAMPVAELIGWDYKDPVPEVPEDVDLFMLDISIDELMGHPGLTWIDHHKSAIEKWAHLRIPGYRVDGVAACRLAWQWFFGALTEELPEMQDYFNHHVNEPLAVRLAGEYDVWDKRDPNAELFQHGLRSRDLDGMTWTFLLEAGQDALETVTELLAAGETLQYARTKENESIIKAQGFTLDFEGLRFLACNAARFNSHLFTAGLTPEHDGCLGFAYDGGKKLWKFSMYGVPGKPDIDFAAIAIKYGGGGHKQACGFALAKLPFDLPSS